MGKVIRDGILINDGVDGRESVSGKVDAFVLEERSIGSLARLGLPKRVV